MKKILNASSAYIDQMLEEIALKSIDSLVSGF